MTDYRKLGKGSFKSRAELASRLMRAINENDYWKKAFLLQQKTSKLERENFIICMKRECEDILQVTRATAEKHFRELIQLYENARGKSEMLEKQVSILQQKNKNKQEKTLELANLLETLAQFNVNVEAVCQIAAEVLRNLEKHDCVHVEKMRKLRQLTWEAEEKNEFPDQEQLRIQNSVLKEIVKSLKKKLQITKYSESKEQIPEKDESPKEINYMNFRENNPDNFSDRTKEHNKSFINPEYNQIPKSFNKLEKLNQGEKFQINENSKHKEINMFNSQVLVGNKYKDTENLKKAQNSIISRIETFQSHFNGIPYEECIIQFSRSQEMKVKFPPILTSSDLPLKIQFIDDEEDYEDASIDKIYVFLRNIEKIVKLKNNGLNCGVQTTRVKFSNSYSQTKLTNSTNSFSRLNVGATMLNSEKRAIERCLSKLEKTVVDLKFNAAYQTRPIMAKDSKYEKNESYQDYIQYLER